MDFETSSGRISSVLTWVTFSGHWETCGTFSSKMNGAQTLAAFACSWGRGCVRSTLAASGHSKYVNLVGSSRIYRFHSWIMVFYALYFVPKIGQK